MEFSKYKLSELVSIIGGGTPKKSESSYWNGDIPWISVKDINSEHRLVENTVEKITQLGLEKSSTKLLKTGDIIISARGTIGEISQLARPMAFNQSCYGLSAVDTLTSNEFIYYWLKYNINYIKANTHGSVFDTITRETFDNLYVNLPSKENQNKITNLLLTLDDKIRLNGKIIENIEKVSSLLFKRWFIDFEFPNEQGLPYRSSGGEMVESELGEIPKGFQIQKLMQLCEVKDGTHDSPKQVEEGYSLVTSKHLKENRIDFATAKLISFEDYEKVNKRSQVSTNDILISMIGTVGRLYWVHNEFINFAIKNIGLIKTSQYRHFEYIYSYFKSNFMQNYIVERTTGSTQQYISLTELRNIPVILPNEKLLEEYKLIVESIYKKIATLVVENQKLEELRENLLPKLLSGEIEIPDESVVEPS